jgi:molybdenum cofactor biosynthesis enzyme
MEQIELHYAGLKLKLTVSEDAFTICDAAVTNFADFVAYLESDSNIEELVVRHKIKGEGKWIFKPQKRSE